MNESSFTAVEADNQHNIFHSILSKMFLNTQFSQFVQFLRLGQTYRVTLWLCVIESDCETVEI